MTQDRYTIWFVDTVVAICNECGSLVHTDYLGKHDEWHRNVLRATLKK